MVHFVRDRGCGRTVSDKGAGTLNQLTFNGTECGRSKLGFPKNMTKLAPAKKMPASSKSRNGIANTSWQIALNLFAEFTCRPFGRFLHLLIFQRQAMLSHSTLVIPSFCLVLTPRTRHHCHFQKAILDTMAAISRVASEKQELVAAKPHWPCRLE